MKKMLPITLILLSACIIVRAQDVGTSNGITTGSGLPQQEEQLANKRLQVANHLSLIKEWYNSQLNYLTINDGWHSAYATDNDLYVSPISVNVIGGRAAVIEKTSVATSTTIERGKCEITVLDTDKKMHILSIYFIQ